MVVSFCLVLLKKIPTPTPGSAARSGVPCKSTKLCCFLFLFQLHRTPVLFDSETVSLIQDFFYLKLVVISFILHARQTK